MKQKQKKKKTSEKRISFRAITTTITRDVRQWRREKGRVRARTLKKEKKEQRVTVGSRRDRKYDWSGKKEKHDRHD